MSGISVSQPSGHGSAGPGSIQRRTLAKAVVGFGLAALGYGSVEFSEHLIEGEAVTAGDAGLVGLERLARHLDFVIAPHPESWLRDHGLFDVGVVVSGVEHDIKTLYQRVFHSGGSRPVTGVDVKPSPGIRAAHGISVLAGSQSGFVRMLARGAEALGAVADELTRADGSFRLTSPEAVEHLWPVRGDKELVAGAREYIVYPTMRGRVYVQHLPLGHTSVEAVRVSELRKQWLFSVTGGHVTEAHGAVSPFREPARTHT